MGSSTALDSSAVREPAASAVGVEAPVLQSVPTGEVQLGKQPIGLSSEPSLSGGQLDRSGDSSSDTAISVETAAAAALYHEAVKRIQSCKMFCNRVSETASMHSPPVTPTELNLHRLLHSAMSEIHRQLECMEAEVGLESLNQRVTRWDSSGAQTS